MCRSSTSENLPTVENPGQGSATGPVIELGPQTLARLDRIEATIESLAEEIQDSVARRMAWGSTVPCYNVSEVAKALKVKPEKVQHWIRAGELAAFNVASTPKGQPQWRITREALAAFQADRAAKLTAPPVAPSKRRARRYRPPIKEILS